MRGETMKEQLLPTRSIVTRKKQISIMTVLEPRLIWCINNVDLQYHIVNMTFSSKLGTTLYEFNISLSGIKPQIICSLITLTVVRF